MILFFYPVNSPKAKKIKIEKNVAKLERNDKVDKIENILFIEGG